jgi:SAM-dependent methyltransferase
MGEHMPNPDFCLESVATFSRLAESYAAKYFHLELYDPYLEQFAQRIQSRGGVVLDVACGPGNVSAYLAKFRPDLKLVGIDLAEGMIKQAKQRVPSATFLVRDCRCIGELGYLFDAAAFAFGLSYLTDEEANRFFISLDAVLAPSAVLYLSTITGEPARSGFDVSSSGDRVHVTYRRVSDVVALVEGAGFAVDLAHIMESPMGAPMATQDLVLIARRAERNESRPGPSASSA